MAGIGFQLKALIKEETLSNKAKAYMYSAFVSSGPWIAAVITVNILLFIANRYLEGFQAQSLSLGTIVYTFVFSQILTAPWQMVITRYYSDTLYLKKYENIMPQFKGLNMLVFFLSLLVTFVFYFNRPLPLYYKVMASYLFIILALLWMIMVALSSIKDYRIITLAYIAGGLFSVLLTIFLMENPIAFEVYTYQSNILFAYLIGTSITYLILLYSFYKIFHYGPTYRQFDFLAYLSKFPSLFFIGLFYTLGLWIDDIIMWLGRLGVNIYDTYQYAPIYDNAVFLAYLTIIPTAILFLVIIETSLYDKYKAYYGLVNGSGTIEEIEEARGDLKRVIREKLLHAMQIQGLITLTVVIFANPIFSFLNLSILIREIFKVAAFGALFNVFILNTILILLYFEARKKALQVAVVFLASNGLFTYLFLGLGFEYYGYGFLIGSSISFVFAIINQKKMLDNLTVRTFLSQPLVIHKPKGIFELIARVLKVFLYRIKHSEDYQENKESS